MVDWTRKNHDWDLDRQQQPDVSENGSYTQVIWQCPAGLQISTDRLSRLSSHPKCLQLLVTLFLEDGVGSTARQELHEILHAHH